MGELQETIVALTSQVGSLEKENKRLQLRCESLERSVQALRGDGNWTYSAPDVPKSHWIEQGHDEDYAEEADRLIEGIVATTRGLRSGEDSVLLPNCTHTIFSDGAIHPHWEQLANAIQLSNGITGFRASNIQLSQCDLRMIESSLRQKGVTELHLKENQFIRGEGVEFAANVLKYNREVGEFSWCGNTIHSEEDALNLVDAVLEHPKISDVKFCSVDSTPDIMYSLVARLFGGLMYLGRATLLDADLSYSDISTKGDQFIPEFIASNPALRMLNLQGNMLTDNDALNIAVALKWNTNLRHLNVDENNLTDEGMHSANYVAIFGVNRSNSANIIDSKIDLNIVSDANHTCDIVGVTEGLRNNEDASGKWNRGVKLIFLIAKRHSAGDNMIRLQSEFAGDGPGIVPHVLGFINSYATIVNSKRGCPYEMEWETYFDWRSPNIGRLYRQNDSNESYRFNLTLLFELARGWKTPEIYQFLRG